MLSFAAAVFEQTAIATSNPVALLMQTNNQSNAYRGLGNVQVDYRLKFFPAIKLMMNAGMDYATSKGHNNASNDAAFTFHQGSQVKGLSACSGTRIDDP